jgi:hypothetical protein
LGDALFEVEFIEDHVEVGGAGVLFSEFGFLLN